MPDFTNGKRSWTEYFRIITPLLLLLLTWLSGGLNKRLDTIENNAQVAYTQLANKIDGVDNKLFHHLTNEELHPRQSQLVSKDRFDEYAKLRKEQLDAMSININRNLDLLEAQMREIKVLIQQHMTETKKK